MSAPKRPDRLAELPFDWVQPATASDRAALHEASRLLAAHPDRFAVLALADLFPQPPRRTTSSGWTPFRLDPPS